MRAIVWDGELRIDPAYPKPVPSPGEAMVRVTMGGICNTDLELVRGYQEFRGVLGHEFVGVVEEAPEPGLIGRRVVGEINANCGSCDTCRRGLSTHCPHGTTLGISGRDGALADYLSLPARLLHVLGDAVPDRAAVFVEPLAAAVQILEQVAVHPSDRVLVLGDGKLGLLVAQVLGLTGCDLTVVGRHEDKLAILSRRGIAVVCDGEATGLGQADVVVDCVGRPDGFSQARELLRPRGTLVMKSTYHGEAAVDLTRLVVDEITLVGSRCGPFQPALRLLAMGLVDVEPLVDSEYSIDAGLAAFERAATRGSLKVLVHME